MDIGTLLIGDLAARARPITLGDGDVLVHEGDDADEVYVITAGEPVATTASTHGAVMVGRIGSGQVAGEVTVIARGQRMATLTADGPTEVRVMALLDFDRVREVSQVGDDDSIEAIRAWVALQPWCDGAA